MILVIGYDHEILGSYLTVTTMILVICYINEIWGSYLTVTTTIFLIGYVHEYGVHINCDNYDIGNRLCSSNMGLIVDSNNHNIVTAQAKEGVATESVFLKKCLFVLFASAIATSNDEALKQLIFPSPSPPPPPTTFVKIGLQ
jgi:hypothetical protein